jgi:hypothetical protein
MKVRAALLSILLLSALSLPAQSLQLTPAGGFYQHAPQVTMACPDTALRIFFTTNGQEPTAADRPYTHPLTLNRSLFSDAALYQVPMCPPSSLYIPTDGVQRVVVLRAAAFNSVGQRVGEVVTQTYIVADLGSDSHGLPVVSICASRRDLTDDSTGIFVPGIWYNGDDWSGNYYQEGREWEREVNMEIYLPDGQVLNQHCGLRTHGGSSRRYAQKGMKVYAREEYGDKRFRARIFEDTDVAAFKRLVLKPFVCAWTHAGVQNMVTEQIARNLRLDVPAIRPAVLYLNGEYWGIYFIQEKPDEHFLKDHYGGNEDYYNVMSNWVNLLDNGTDVYFQQMMSWFATADLAIQENYEEACRLIDVDNFVDYQIFEIFTNNEDWPANNMRCWQYFMGKWRWIFYDGDATLKHLEWGGFEYATYDGDEEYPASRISTLLFRKLLENPDFQKKFVERYNSLCHSILSYYSTKPYLDAATDAIQEEIPLQMDRFKFPATYKKWSADVKEVDEFLRQRPTQAIAEMLRYIHVKEDVGALSFYPNPTVGEVMVSVTVAEPGIRTLCVYDMGGRMVYSNLLYCEEGQSQFFRQLLLPAGTYVVRVGDKSGKILIVN